MVDVDVIIIGTGQAGVPLATRLAGAGKRVLIAERAKPGGTCINYGCTPTKTMIASARAAQVARTAARLGVHTSEPRIDLPAIVDRKDRIVASWSEEVRERLEAAGERVRFVHGQARFVGPREIDVAGQRYRAETIVIDVGARPTVPPIAGLDGVPWLDNTRLMALRQLPSHLLVLGGGYIGCELAQMFRRFGAPVTIIERSDHLLGREDPEIATEIENAFRREGIDLRFGSAVSSVTTAGDGIILRLAGGDEIRASHLLVAAGRTPNTDDLGCEAAGIKLDRRGFIITDDYYRTSAPGVYAVGDVAGEPQFTHTAWDDHRILFDLLLGRSDRGRGGRVVPFCVFTDPQVARAGMTERQARAAGREFEIATLPYTDIARALETDETAGVCKLLFDTSTDRVLGVAMVGAEAGEILQIFVPIMVAGISLRAIVDAEFIHPTFAEGVQQLAMRLRRFAL